jgi:hypothetical protein
MSRYFDGKPNDDIIDVVGFLCYELVRKLTETALQVKRETTDVATAKNIRQAAHQIQLERLKALEAEKAAKMRRGIQPAQHGIDIEPIPSISLADLIETPVVNGPKSNTDDLPFENDGKTDEIKKANTENEMLSEPTSEESPKKAEKKCAKDEKKVAKLNSKRSPATKGAGLHDGQKSPVNLNSDVDTKVSEKSKDFKEIHPEEAVSSSVTNSHSTSKCKLAVGLELQGSTIRGGSYSEIPSSITTTTNLSMNSPVSAHFSLKQSPLQAFHIYEAYRRLQNMHCHTQLFRGGALRVNPRLV